MLAGARDLAIVLVLGDAGVRAEQLAGVDRQDVTAARKGSKLRTMRVRHGKGDRGRTVKLSERTTPRDLRWERERAGVLGTPARDAPLFITTLGRRKADGTYVSVGGRWGQPVLTAVMKRLGAAARIPEDLRHTCALRHTVRDAAPALGRRSRGCPDVARARLHQDDVDLSCVRCRSTGGGRHAAPARRSDPRPRLGSGCAVAVLVASRAGGRRIARPSGPSSRSPLSRGAAGLSRPGASNR